MTREERVKWLETAEPGEIENWANADLRHKTGVQPYDYLKHWLSISRHFGFATHDDSYGEFEKEFCIIVRRMVVAERQLEELQGYVEDEFGA